MSPSECKCTGARFAFRDISLLLIVHCNWSWMLVNGCMDSCMYFISCILIFVVFACIHCLWTELCLVTSAWSYDRALLWWPSMPSTSQSSNFHFLCATSLLHTRELFQTDKSVVLVLVLVAELSSTRKCLVARCSQSTCVHLAVRDSRWPWLIKEEDASRFEMATKYLTIINKQRWWLLFLLQSTCASLKRMLRYITDTVATAILSVRMLFPGLLTCIPPSSRRRGLNKGNLILINSFPVSTDTPGQLKIIYFNA